MVHLHVFVGEWVRIGNSSVFKVDHARGGRFFHLPEGCKHRDLIDMVIEDYLFDKSSMSLELSYSLPEEIFQMMPPDTPPNFVTSDRQVTSLMELCRTNLVRLCMSFLHIGTSGDNMSLSQHDQESVGMAREKVYMKEGGDEDDDDDGEWEEEAEDLHDDNGLDDDNGLYGDNGLDDEEDGNIKDEMDDEDLDYSVYRKLEDENGDEGTGQVQRSLLTPAAKWVDGIEVGKCYPTKKELMFELRMTAVQQKFAFTSPTSNMTKFAAKCYVVGCQWRVRATTKNEPRVFSVTKYVNIHTCSVVDRMSKRRRCTPEYIVRLFNDRAGIIDGIVPQHIKDSMWHAYGLRLDYSTSYRTLIYARELVRGSTESGYETLPSYLSQIKETNLGSVTDLVTDGGLFKYLLLSLGPSIHGFQYCRRVLVVDGTHLTGKYGGVMLVAAGQDANFQIFPLAFGIADAEYDESWDWFFSNLKKCFSDQFEMAIISDRHSSIAKACKNVLPWATRGIFYYHLQHNIITHFRAKDLMHLVCGATYAYTVADYDRNMAQLRIAHPDLADYMENADPRLWERVHFPGNRYTLLTSNIAESINSMVKNAKEFPVSYLLEYIRERLGLWFWKRREDAIGLTIQFSRGVEALLAIRLERADTMVVNRIATWVFHVVDRKRDFTVDLEARKCSCGLYAVEIIPCSHALAAITEAGMHMSSFIESTYSRNSLYNTYSVNIYPT